MPIEKTTDAIVEQGDPYPQENRFTTAEGRTYEVFSLAGVYIRTERTAPEDILNRSYGHWEFSGNDQGFTVEGIFTSLDEIPDFWGKDPVGNEIILSDFQSERKTDGTGRNYQQVFWQQQGFATISIASLDEEQFRKNWVEQSFYDGRIKADPVIIYKTDLAEGEVWRVRISGELNF